MHPRLLVFCLVGFLVPSFAAAAEPYPAPGGSPGYGTPDGSPAPGSPDGSAPGYGDPGSGDPGHGGPGYGDPGYGDPGYGDPGYEDPGYGSPSGEWPPEGGPVDRVLSEAQIVGVLHVVNQGAIRAGQQALRKATDPAVREFANRLVAEHAALDDQLVALGPQIGVLPEASRLSAKLERASAHVLAKLESFDGPAYDVAYVDLQLAGRGGLVALLDFLGTQAATPELKGAIDFGRPLVLSQLQQAITLRERLPVP